jgi:hypothetical protein
MFEDHSRQIGPRAEKEGMSVGDHARVPGEQIKSDHHDGKDEDPRKEGNVESAVEDVGPQGKGKKDSQ